jgi:hypothetical protein
MCRPFISLSSVLPVFFRQLDMFCFDVATTGGPFLGVFDEISRHQTHIGIYAREYPNAGLTPRF